MGLVVVEDFGVPVPGETVLILAAVYAGTGRLNVVIVALLGFCGALLGDNIGFAIGHFGGGPLAQRHPNDSTKPLTSSNATAARSSSSPGFGRYIFLTNVRRGQGKGRRRIGGANAVHTKPVRGARVGHVARH